MFKTHKSQIKFFKLLSYSILALVILSTVYANFKLEKKLANSNSDIAREFPLVVDLEYVGYDSNNNIFKILGSKGYDLGNNNKKLTDATGHFFTSDGKTLIVKGKEAELRPGDNILNLIGEPSIKTEDGALLKASNLKLNYQNKQAWGEGGVKLSNQSGYIEAEKFSTEDNYSKIVFSGGRVKSVIYGKEENE